MPFVLSKFYNEIFTQFGKRIKVIRSVNALDYIQTFVELVCVDSGIIHQTSCNHTSQQNGVAECKHRYLLDVAHTLLFQMQVPKQFWSDVVLTSYHLINRIPFAVLNHKSPFFLLHPSSSTFSLTPRVFGCIHVLDPGHDVMSSCT